MSSAQPWEGGGHARVSLCGCFLFCCPQRHRMPYKKHSGPTLSRSHPPHGSCCFKPIDAFTYNPGHNDWRLFCQSPLLRE